MINKYAEIKDRLDLYNACKGILRIKLASGDASGSDAGSDPLDPMTRARLNALNNGDIDSFMGTFGPDGEDASKEEMAAAADASNNNKHRLFRSIGLGTGTGVGGAAGYYGSDWLSNKLGLKGQKGWRRAADVALRTAGTAGGAALGGYGGYRLGKAIDKRYYTDPYSGTFDKPE